MAFICASVAGDDKYQFFRDGRAAAVVVRVGHDPDAADTWFAHVGFDVIPPGDLQYYFFLCRVNAATGEEICYHSGRETAHFICGKDRKHVLEAVLMATKVLLDHEKPKQVYRVTHDAALSSQALEKHFEICALFKLNGYEVSRYDEYHGQRIWWMELLEEGIV